MRRIKILFLFIVLFLLSGCTANYRLSISESGEIEEDIKFLESTSVLKTFSNSIQSDLDKELQNVKQSGIYDSYTMDAFVEDGYGIGTGKRVYSSFDNFKNNSIIVTVEDKENKMPELSEKVEEISKVELVKDNEDGTKQYVVFPKDNIDLRKTLFDVLPKENITIFELRKSEATLEEAFIKLINKNEKGGKENVDNN